MSVAYGVVAEDTRRLSVRQARFRRMTQPYIKSTIKKSADKEIDNIYITLQSHIMRYQSARTGLFPRYSTDSTDGYVRDSIYCALSLWAMSAAYQRLDDDRGRAHEMRQSAVKSMRGILLSWMYQAPSLEAFKADPDSSHALHSIFNLHNGNTVIQTQSYAHLQIDVVALYLLSLVQITASNVQVIYEQAEVDFVQNLVYYIERAYRTPDYGMWERGTRYNDGTPELHASTLGMVKAALESVNGFNVYGNLGKGRSNSVIYVDIDAHNRNRTTFEELLPRESSSKNTDAALLPTIGWPCYATHDTQLVANTKNKLLRKLQGRYGLKRFLRDGYRSTIEDTDRRFYDAHETVKFAKVEPEWPMFLVYLYITAELNNETEEAAEYWQRLYGDDGMQLLTLDNQAQSVLPECFYVCDELVDNERQSPGSQPREPVSVIDEGHFLWAQALLCVARLLHAKLISASDLDPIYRHVPASHRPKFNHRHSAFQVIAQH